MMTTSKNLILLLIVFVIALPAPAQNLSGGVVAGYTTGSLKITEIPEGFFNSIEGKDIRGIQAGFYAKLKAGPVYFRPLALLHLRNGKVAVRNDMDINLLRNYTLAHAEVPVLIGVNILGPLFIEAGPMYNYVIGSTGSIAGEQVPISKSGLGYRIGAGAEIGRVMLSVSYQGLKNGNRNGLSSLHSPDILVFGAGLRLSK